MGCLVAKCALSNMALKGGQDVYINILALANTPTKEVNNISLKKVGTDELISVTDTRCYHDKIQSADYFTPIGILMKGTYNGWSSFTPDFEDERTLMNFFRLAEILDYDNFEKNHNIIQFDDEDEEETLSKCNFNASEVHKLIELKKYSDAWEIIDEAIRISNHEHVYFTNFYGVPQKLYYSAISSEAIDYIFKKNIQNDIINTFWQCKDYKTVDDLYNGIQGFSQEIINYTNEIKAEYKSKRKDYRSTTISAYSNFLFENSGRIDNKISSIWKTFDYRLFKDSFCDLDVLADKTYPEKTFEANDYVEWFGTLIKDFIFQNYVNASFGYFNQNFMPTSNVNTEEYTNSFNIEALKMVNYCLIENQKQWHDGCEFEGVVTITRKKSKLHATYKNHDEEYDAYGINQFNKLILEYDESHTPDQLIFVGERLDMNNENDNIVYILNIEEKTYYEMYETEVYKQFDISLI